MGFDTTAERFTGKDITGEDIIRAYAHFKNAGSDGADAEIAVTEKVIQFRENKLGKPVTSEANLEIAARVHATLHV